MRNPWILAAVLFTLAPVACDRGTAKAPARAPAPEPPASAGQPPTEPEPPISLACPSARATSPSQNALNITPPGDQTSHRGEDVRVALKATAADERPITFEIAGLPPGVTLDPSTGVISGRIGADAEGEYTVVAAAFQGEHSACAQFTWVVPVS